LVFEVLGYIAIMIEAGTIAELIGGIDTWCQKTKAAFCFRCASLDI
jgi:hypothetical protein